MPRRSPHRPGPGFAAHPAASLTPAVYGDSWMETTHEGRYLMTASAGSLTGRRALVTSAASGIGAACANALAAAGAHVVAADIDAAGADRVFTSPAARYCWMTFAPPPIVTS
ncbi:MAG: SDR family NAD(P)-dependent oxidoreductase [Streptosporangiaceae bacterium]